MFDARVIPLVPLGLVEFGDPERVVVFDNNLGARAAHGRAGEKKLFNLRLDPYERADITSNTYYDWLLDHLYFIFFAQTIAADFVQTLKEFPPAQHAASFTIDDAMAKMSEAGSGTH